VATAVSTDTPFVALLTASRQVLIYSLRRRVVIHSMNLEETE